MHLANIKIAEIKLDMMKECFDTTMEKYKPLKSKPVIESPRQKVIPPTLTITYLHELSDKFKDWTKNIRNINIDHSVDYYGVYRVLLRWVKIPLDKTAATIKGENWSTSTYNKRLNILRSFFNWLQSSTIISINPLAEVSRKRGKKKKRQKEEYHCQNMKYLFFWKP